MIHQNPLLVGLSDGRVQYSSEKTVKLICISFPSGCYFSSSERIDKIIGRLFTVCQEEKFKSENIKLKAKIDKYVLSLELISKLTSWYSVTGFQGNFILDVMQVQVYDKLMPLALEYEKLHKKLAKQILNRGGILLEISDTMPLKKQFGNRIESVSDSIKVCSNTIKCSE